MRRMKAGFTISCLFILCWPAIAQNQAIIQLPTTEATILSGSELLLFEDTTNAMTIEQAMGCLHFSNSSRKLPSLGYTSSTIWLKAIINNADPDELWNMVILNPNLTDVKFYSSMSGFRPLSQSRFDRDEIPFIFPLRAGRQTVYIRIQTDTWATIPISLRKTETLQQASHRMNTWQGILYGIILCFVVYNAAIFFSLREKVFIYFVLYTISLCLVDANATGYFAHFCPVFMRWVCGYPVFACLSAIFGLMFFEGFIKIHRSRNVGTIHNTLKGLLVVPIVLHAGGLVLWANILSQVVIVIMFTYLVFRCIENLIYEKYPEGPFFGFSWLILYIGVVVFVLSAFGIIQYNERSILLPQIGLIFDAVILSILLRSRVRRLNADRERSNKTERDLLLRYNKLFDGHNIMLQHTVLQKTSELERVNRIKDKFFAIVAHDLRNPLHSLAAFIQLMVSEQTKMFSHQELKTLVARLSDSVANTRRLTENLLAWAKSQMDSEQTDFRSLELAPIISEAFVNLLPHAQRKNIKLDNEVCESLNVVADENHVTFILRNLLSNAIKFTPENGTVAICAGHGDGKVKITVTDTGVGMNAKVIDGLFRIDVRKNTKGTHGESGTGLGLVLCKEFVELNDGTLEVSSIPGTGSTFTVTLPAAISVGTNVQTMHAETCL